jgi:hypothetical protein
MQNDVARGLDEMRGDLNAAAESRQEEDLNSNAVHLP